MHGFRDLFENRKIETSLTHISRMRAWWVRTGTPPPTCTRDNAVHAFAWNCYNGRARISDQKSGNLDFGTDLRRALREETARGDGARRRCEETAGGGGTRRRRKETAPVDGGRAGHASRRREEAPPPTKPPSGGEGGMEEEAPPHTPRGNACAVDAAEPPVSPSSQGGRGSRRRE